MNALDYNLSLTSGTFPLKAALSFPLKFPAFQGHFPGNPILPAFMHIQAALDVLRAANFPCALKEISTGKFTHPITPEHPVEVVITATASENIFDATLFSGSLTHSTFTVTVM